MIWNPWREVRRLRSEVAALKAQKKDLTIRLRARSQRLHDLDKRLRQLETSLEVSDAAE